LPFFFSSAVGLIGVREVFWLLWPFVNDLTQLLNAAGQGDSHAAAQLMPLIYDELRRVAALQMAREKPGQTLDATALVHEAYLRLVDQGDGQQFANVRHFFAAAAQAMRRILVENARRKQSLKRGGEARRVWTADLAAPDPDDRLLALDEALTRLAARDPLAARVVELHHFAGLGHDQVAEALAITVYLARRKWTYARAWLRAAVTDG
jgi:RNA polymerase sigma factor (TIGR02999 family)